jgi:hypothetical protein
VTEPPPLTMREILMTDHELLEQFEQLTLPLECLRHPEHVRIAYLYLTKLPVLEALQTFSAALKSFAAAHGKASLYHETITWAYIFLIHERRARSEKAQDWDEFARNNADLLTWKNGILTRFYKEETLASDIAKRIFIFPDRTMEPRP